MALKEKNVHEIFVISLVLKALNALLQLFFGSMLLITGSATTFIRSLLTHELVEDPHDFFASHIASLFSHISMTGQYYAAFYLLSHGIIKMALVIALIKNKLWAYPVSIFVLLAFILYQTVSFFESHSIFLALLTIFDLAVIWLIAHEYRYLLRKAEKA